LSLLVVDVDGSLLTDVESLSRRRRWWCRWVFSRRWSCTTLPWCGVCSGRSWTTTLPWCGVCGSRLDGDMQRESTVSAHNIPFNLSQNY